MKTRISIDNLNREIAERKRTEELLRQSEERLRMAMEAAKVGTWRWDPATNMDTRDASFNRMLGLEPSASTQPVEEFIGFVYPEDRRGVEDAIGKAVRERGQYSAEFRIVRPDGEVCWLSDRGRVICDEAGEVRYMTGAVVDITERKQAEEKLRETSQYLENLFNYTNAPIIVWDPQFKITRFNHAFEALTGRSAHDVIGKSIKILFPTDKVESSMEFIRETLEGKRWETIEINILHLDGAVRTVLWNSATLFDLDGKTPVATIAQGQDITDYKKAEDRQAQLLKELESANRELNDFAYITSHDLKAPLRGIKTLAEWLSTDYADKLGEQGKEQMGLLLRRVERMHNLIEGILQYSRVGRVQENRVAVNLNKLMSEIIDTLAPPANITITVENELPTIESEPTRIAQVFQNLMSNAIKYMDKPQGQIKISCVEENGFWKFGVADNGPGIEEKHFERIFQIFQTLSPRDDFESTGIGLTITKKIVELYGGKIWVESKVGEGSTFFFTLPKQEMEVKDANLEASVVS